LASPTFTGDPRAPTPAPGDNDTSIATTAFVQTSFAPINSPTFTGDPKAPTPLTADNDTSIATTAFVKAAIAAGGGGSASITVSDTPPGSPTPGALWWESDTGTLWIYYNDGTSSQWVMAAGGGPVPGAVLQQLYTDTNATPSTSSFVAAGSNTIPQQTDGIEVLSITVTPKAATSKIRVDAIVPASCNTNATWFVSLFRDGGANALVTVPASHNASFMLPAPLTFEVAAGSIALTTFKIRIGLAQSGSSLFLNSSSGTPFFGGSIRATMALTEFAA
jgi:hypothetical protein